MKNKGITHSKEQVKIYGDYYKPSFNLWRVFRSIFGVMIFGTGSVASNYSPAERKRFK